MISNKEFKRLSEIDEKMLNNKYITDEELKERTEIIQKIKQEYLKCQGIIQILRNTKETMRYESEQFEYEYELTKFLNENNIKKENIISIYTSKYFHHLIYIVEN